MSEKDIQTRIMLAASQTGATVFRNNTGNGVLGQVVRQTGGEFHIINGRRVQFGLCVGSSDLIGWRTVTVTPDMVGKRIALFLALEVKTPTGKPTPEQVNFIEAVGRAGGMAGVVRNVDEAIGVCNPLL
jgi:hypothetical protein